MSGREPWFDSLPPRVQQAIRSADFAVTLKASDMDGLSALNLARDAKIIATYLRHHLEAANSHEGAQLIGTDEGDTRA